MASYDQELFVQFTATLHSFVEELKKKERIASSCWLYKEPRIFVSGHQNIRFTGKSMYRRTLTRLFGKSSSRAAEICTKQVIATLKNTVFTPHIKTLHDISSDTLTRFYHTLSACISAHWQIIYYWQYADFFSYIQTCCRQFQLLTHLPADLYLESKHSQNKQCLDIYTLIRSFHNQHPLSLPMLSYLICRANWIDSFTQKEHLFLTSFKDEINDILDESEPIEEHLLSHPCFHMRSLIYDIKGHPKTILYECDNHGEIYLDLLFIEVLLHHKHRVIISTKSSTILNDVTFDDLHSLLHTPELKHLLPYFESKQCTIVSNGSGDVIPLRHLASNTYIESYKASDLVILKGQGNFESYPLLSSSLFSTTPITYVKPHCYIFGLKSHFTYRSFSMIHKSIPLNTPICLYYG